MQHLNNCDCCQPFLEKFFVFRTPCYMLYGICHIRYICQICYMLSRQLYFISRICSFLPFARLSIVTEAVVLALIAICTTDVGFSSISCPVTKMTTESGGGGGGWGGEGAGNSK